MQQESWCSDSLDERMIACAVALLLLVTAGCTRNHYHEAADQDSYNVLHEKTSGRPWQLPERYSVDADPRSRLFDPSDPNAAGFLGELVRGQRTDTILILRVIPKSNEAHSSGRNDLWKAMIAVGEAS